MRSEIALESRLAMDRIEAEQGHQTFVHRRVCVGPLETVPVAECVLRLALQIVSGFRQTGFPGRPGAFMRNVLHGMP